jgi:hypothetical protein
LLEGDRRGTLSKESAEELEQHRHWGFLRKLIGEEILEKSGNVSSGPEGEGAEVLSRSLAPHLGMPEAEVQKHLEPHIRDGQITLTKGPDGTLRWSWAAS